MESLLRRAMHWLCEKCSGDWWSFRDGTFSYTTFVTTVDEDYDVGRWRDDGENGQSWACWVGTWDWFRAANLFSALVFKATADLCVLHECSPIVVRAVIFSLNYCEGYKTRCSLLERVDVNTFLSLERFFKREILAHRCYPMLKVSTYSVNVWNSDFI